MKIFFILLLSIISHLAVANNFELKCYIHTKSEGVDPFEHCATFRNDKSIEISPKIMEKMVFNEKGLTEFYFNGGCYWVNRQGKSRKTHCFDNGPDYFVQGLARYVAPDGKFGFMDEKLDVLIPPNFDFVFPFENGKAQFCNGCKPVPDGEHSVMKGGTWGFVDKKGKVIEDSAVKPGNSK